MTMVAHFITHNDINRGFEQNLKATSAYVDRIIVTDNHSRDGTVECALDYGCDVASAEPQVPLFQWEDLIKVSWYFVKLYTNDGDWILNLFGDEYPKFLNFGTYTGLQSKAATVELRHLWDTNEMLERVDDYWFPFRETRIYKMFTREPKLDLRQDKLHPAAHSRHVLPRYIEHAERRSEVLDIDAQIHSVRYAKDLTREGVIHREFSPRRFKDAPYGYSLLMKVHDG